MIKNLQKVKFGNTDLYVSRLCYGTLALGPYHSNLSLAEGTNLLVKAYQLGVNFWDTAELYETYSYIKEALKQLSYPNDIVVSSRSYNRTYEEMKQSISNTLESLGIESISIFGVHELDGIEDFKASEGALEALKEAKQKGLIKYISVTMHSIESVNIVSELGYIDVVFPLYNIAGIGIKDGTAKDMTVAISNARKNGKAIYAMKVLAGGHLVKSVDECFKFVSNNPHIDSIAVGVDNEHELIANIAYFANDMENYQISKSKVKIHTRKINIDPWCEGCGDCIRACPNDALSIEFSQAKVDFDKCVLCGYCASFCKYFCIKVVKTN